MKNNNTENNSAENYGFFAKFIKKPVLVWVLNIIVILVGYVSFMKLDIREEPKIVYPTISIHTDFSGASAETIESCITEMLEENLAGIEGLESMESVSTFGSSKITLNFTSETNPDIAAANVRDRVAKAKDGFPSKELRDPIISKSSGNENQLITICATSDKLSTAEVMDLLSTSAKGSLESIPGVAKIRGLSESGLDSGSFQIFLYPNFEKMFLHKVTVKDIKEAVFQNSFKKPLGEFKMNNIKYSAILNQIPKHPEEYNRMIISSNKNSLVRMEDVCKLEIMIKRPDTISRYNGKDSVNISIIPQPGANPLTISAEVKERLKEIKKILPKSVKIEITSDKSENIRKSINSVYRTIFEAILFVFLVVLIFLQSLRSTFIPMITIPICLLGGFFIMYLFNFTLNKLTLLAMVLAVGLVVDDAIVVMENIHKKMEEGLDRFKASALGIQQISFSIISMTLTLVAVYAPITLVSGMIGLLFKEFAITLAGTVLISGFVALILTPMLCYNILESSHETSNFKIFNIINIYLKKIETGYKNLLNWSLINFKKVSLFVILFSVFSLFVAKFKLNQTLYPDIDRGLIYLQFHSPKGSTVDYTNYHILKIEKLLAKLNYVESFETYLESGGSNNYVAIQLIDHSKRKLSANQIIQDLEKKLQPIQSGLNLMFEAAGSASGDHENQVEFSIQSNKSYDDIEIVASDIFRLLYTNPYIDQTSMLSTNIAKVKSYEFFINQEKCALLNVHPLEIADMLSLVIRGQSPVDRFEKNGKRYPVRLMVDDEFKKDPENVNKLFVKAYKQGEYQMVSLNGLIDIKEIKTRPMSFKKEGLRSYSIYFKVKKYTPLSFYKEISPSLDKLLPTGYKQVPGKNLKKAIKESKNILFVFLLALLFIFLIMAAQFESFLDPFIIILTVPFSIAAAVLSLVPLASGSLNIYSYIALITLIGLITKHGILLIDFANKFLEENELSLANIEKAIKEACLTRLRPILMTTLAMVLGAFPLAFSTGVEYEIRNQIGWIIISGMSVGTFLTLIFLPGVYIFFKRIKYRNLLK